ncbi:DODA-type extradiol aromatic ring-opening family dioxygenase [Corynebacterium confusum]|uniref:DODA-type extradiol aromatic ring-opening family dioxygenase n=1 Tax=Corynebacterium confusum TaxID=71254 RepID=UPI0025B3800B|nr:class III extradiol ring-cleavage dioxygenase [Corynebacterium confusum]WJY88595.1 LigB family dioxygenase [Corynebacterium confusum]
MPTLAEEFNPVRPAGAIYDLRERALPETHLHRRWEPADGPLPALFISHGAPPALGNHGWMNDLYDWSRSLPKPRAIVVVSAHWENAPVAINATAADAPLFYDFSGFDPEYFTLRYPTPDAGELAQRVAGLLGYQPVHQFADRGLDHGAFIPLMAMYPAGDVPVVQVSMPSLNPQDLLELGEKLRPQRTEGILVIGSGYMTHSFAVFRNPELSGHLDAFDEWAAANIHSGNVDALTDYLHQGPGARIAHPTADHYVPLLLAMGAATDPTSAHTVFTRKGLGNHIRSIEVY